MRTALIDADWFLYAIGSMSEGEPVEFALHTVKVMIQKITKAAGCERCICFLTGSGNFREEVATIQPYKGNRVGNEKPEHFKAIRDYIQKEFKTYDIQGMEADDAMAIVQCQRLDDKKYETVICSLDKDLKMVPGFHYSWELKRSGEVVKPEALWEVEETEGLRWFYTQILTGDSVDNIPGLYKMTGKRATKKMKEALNELETEYELYDHVYNCYRTAYRDCGILIDECDEVVTKWITEIGRLLWMKRSKDEPLWSPPVSPAEGEHEHEEDVQPEPEPVQERTSSCTTRSQEELPPDSV